MFIKNSIKRIIRLDKFDLSSYIVIRNSIYRIYGNQPERTMKMTRLMYHTFREGYGTDQIRKTMTVGELRAFLEDYDEDSPIYLSFDSGYTYGGITEDRFEENYGENEEAE